MTTDLAKRIVYRSVRDYDCFVDFGDGEQYLGSAPTRLDAERRCDDYALNFYLDTCTYEKAAAFVMEGI